MDSIKEFVLQLVAAVGGGIGIALILLRLAKGLFQKSFESAIDTAAQKTISKYCNVLQRKTRAYEILLEKEFSFYEVASDLLSDLIVDIQDFSFDMGVSPDCMDSHDYNKAKETALKVIRFIPKFKKATLLAHTYLPEQIDSVCTNLISDLQKSLNLFHGEVKSALTEDDYIVNKRAILENEKNILMDCARINGNIILRIQELSQD